MAWNDYNGLVFKGKELLEGGCNQYPWHVHLELDGLSIKILKDCHPIFGVKGKEIKNIKELNPKRTTYGGTPCERIMVNGYSVWYYKIKDHRGYDEVNVHVYNNNNGWHCHSGMGVLTIKEQREKEEELMKILEEIG